MSIEAMKLALEALEKISMGGDPRWADDVIPTLRTAIEQAEKQDCVAMDDYMVLMEKYVALKAKLKEKNT